MRLTIAEISEAAHQMGGALEGLRHAVEVGTNNADDVSWSAVSWLLDSALSSYSAILELAGDLHIARQLQGTDVLTLSFKDGRDVTAYASPSSGRHEPRASVRQGWRTRMNVPSVEHRLARARGAAGVLSRLAGREVVSPGDEPSPAFWRGVGDLANGIEDDLAALQKRLTSDVQNRDAPDVLVER